MLDRPPSVELLTWPWVTVLPGPCWKTLMYEISCVATEHFLALENFPEWHFHTSSSNCLVSVSQLFLALINSWRDLLITICSRVFTHLLQCLYLLVVWYYLLWRSQLVRKKFLSCCWQLFTHLLKLNAYKFKTVVKCKHLFTFLLLASAVWFECQFPNALIHNTWWVQKWTLRLH